jgi:hypothetical protein
MTKTEYKPIPQNEAECLFSLTIHDFEKLALMLESIERVRDDECLVQGLSNIATEICLESVERLRKAYLDAGLSTETIEGYSTDGNVVVKLPGGDE